jgi:LysM repeat protein
MRLKIFVFILASAFLAFTFLATWHYIRNDLQPEQKVAEALKEKSKRKPGGTGPDPGISIFNKAVGLINDKDLEAARERLIYLTEVYKESSRFAEARRILGEINMDRLFSRNPMPGKLEYTVKPGEGMLNIAKSTETTIAFLKRVNNLSGGSLRAGERLVAHPLNFEITISLSSNTLVINHNGRFFKEYPIRLVNLPPGNGPTTKNPIIKTNIHTKTAWITEKGNEKAVREDDPQHGRARKWMQTAARNGRPGILFRPMADRTIGTESKSTTDDVVFGIFFDDHDMEELSTIIRRDTPVIIQN